MKYRWPITFTCAIVLGAMLGAYSPMYDLGGSFIPAARALLCGQSPYEATFYNPPWALLPVLPFAVLPWPVAQPLFGALVMSAFAFVCYRIRIPPVGGVAFLLSLPVLETVYLGNLEWLSLLSLCVPVGFDILLAMIKPQVAGGLALYRAAEIVASRQLGAGITGADRLVRLRAFVGAGAICLLTFLAWNWPVAGPALLLAKNWNSSVWPWGIPVGAGLLYAAYRQRDPLFALAASPFLSPYCMVTSYVAPMLLLARRWPRAALALVVASWIGCTIWVMIMG